VGRDQQMVPKPTTAAESALRMTVATEAIMVTARVAVKVARKTEAKAEARGRRVVSPHLPPAVQTYIVASRPSWSTWLAVRLLKVVRLQWWSVRGGGWWR
jgi:hypothetical protein